MYYNSKTINLYLSSGWKTGIIVANRLTSGESADFGLICCSLDGHTETAEVAMSTSFVKQPWLVAWEYNTKREQLHSFEIQNIHVTDENVIIICAKVP